MPSISQKGQAMPASPIRKLVPYAEGAKARGIHVHHLNIGQPDIETPEVVMEGLTQIDRKVIEYSHSAGFQSYREKLADYYNRVGTRITVDNVIVTTGGSEALLFALQTCFNPGDEVIIPEPFYANYNGFSRAAGVKVIPITARIEDDYSLPPISEFEEKVGDKTKGIILCNPANPTGYLYTTDELMALQDLVKKHDLYLIADEVYREFCYDDAIPRSCLKLNEIEQNVIVVDSVSKRYSMCGARVGAMVTKNQDVLDTVMKFAQARLSPPTLGQIAGEMALDTPQSYFDEVNREYNMRRNVLVDGLKSIPGVLCPKPKGAFYCMARLPIDDSDRFCQWILEEFQWNGSTVMMAPGSGFYATEGAGKDEVRLAYVLKQEDLLESVLIIREALKVYPGTKQ
ncbi:MAG: pyridoxal phosphate-dependent aminotransferase [Flavobacteriales bacterium]|nr:pyridoxal phosphate-dependent aminotransferase [Flavobacteriales bacterium]